MSTTESVESVHSIEEIVGVEAVLASLKTFAVADLFKVSKVSLAEAEKRIKTGKTEPKAVAEKKATPKQLRKPTQWVQFTLQHALRHGWEAFTVENKKSQEIIEMPASVVNDAGEHVYPNGKKMILTHAMSLSKQRWAPKAKEGTNQDLYNEFSAEFDAQPEEEVEAAQAAPAKPKMVRKTAEEKEAEKEAKAAKKAEEKAAKAAKKAEEKAAKTVKAPAKAVKAAAPAAATPAATPAGVKPGKKAAKKVEEWTCPADGNVYPWSYKGKNFLRNSDNQVWEAEANGSCGDWAGVFIPSEDRIDESAADPFADEE